VANKMPYFDCEVSLSYSGFLTCCTILRHGADGFTSLLIEVVLWGFIALKNPILLGWV
jgi:hypothetical protein